jgi:ABC-2 type transport system permease protein
VGLLYAIASMSAGVSLAMTAVFLAICSTLVWCVFKTGYRLKT